MTENNKLCKKITQDYHFTGWYSYPPMRLGHAQLYGWVLFNIVCHTYIAETQHKLGTNINCYYISAMCSFSCLCLHICSALQYNCNNVLPPFIHVFPFQSKRYQTGLLLAQKYVSIETSKDTIVKTQKILKILF